METDFSDYITYMYPVSGLLLPIAEPHVTLASLGKISEVSFGRDEAEAILRHAGLEAPGEVAVDDVEWFGDSKDIPVLLLAPSILLKRQRGMIDVLMKAVGIQETSDHPFRPHVSISYDGGLPEDFSTPGFVVLEKPQLWWGNERLPV